MLHSPRTAFIAAQCRRRPRGPTGGRRFGFALVCLPWLGAAVSAAPAPVPLPPQPPAELRVPHAPSPAPAPPPLPAPPAPTPAAAGPAFPPAAPKSAPPPSPEDIALCDRLLAGGKVKAERLPPIEGENGCGVPAPVKLSAIVLAAGRTIAIEPAVTVRCGLADALADWIRDDLAPLLAARGGGLARLTGTGGYQCRGRNRVVGAKLSEHATGNAIDIQAFGLANRSAARITQVGLDAPLFAQVKLTTCARFSTVLGPGSDGYHEDNLHLDLEPRRGGRHFCRWQLP